RLIAKMGPYYLEDFIGRLDHWGESEPAEFAKNSSHYAILLDWFAKDLAAGLIQTPNGAQVTPVRMESEIPRWPGRPELPTALEEIHTAILRAFRDKLDREDFETYASGIALVSIDPCEFWTPT